MFLNSFRSRNICTTTNVEIITYYWRHTSLNRKDGVLSNNISCWIRTNREIFCVIQTFHSPRALLCLKMSLDIYQVFLNLFTESNNQKTFHLRSLGPMAWQVCNFLQIYSHWCAYSWKIELITEVLKRCCMFGIA